MHDVINTLVYCAKSSDVETTIIDGQIVMDRGAVVTVDEARVRRDAATFGGELYHQGVRMWQDINKA